MAKAKAKHRTQGSIDPKRRKMKHFQRVSISSSALPSSQTAPPNQSQKKRKLAADDINHSQEQQQQQQAWKGKKKKKNDHQQQLHQRPTIPYRKKDRILLIGEGDFSFARSLVEHHRCKNVFATCYDSKDALLAKYQGQAERNIKKFLNCDDEDEDVSEGQKKIDLANDPGKSDRDGKDSSNDDDDEEEEEAHAKRNLTQGKEHTRKVLYSVDARKLGASVVGGGKDIRRGIPKKKKTQHYQWNKTKESPKDKQEEGGSWDIISFNFPHVGGLSTDVNRQVRANQELLVAFFKASVSLLSRQSDKEDNQNDDDDDDYEDGYDYPTSSEEADSEEDEPQQQENNIRRVPRNSGQIIVTLFEGEPYTLWNIKDLARHAGLVVVTSFKFPWASYPGYSHARTLGIVESRSHSKSGSGKDTGGGGWKGEDREARSYVFELKRDNNPHPPRQQQKNKRGRVEKEGDDSSDDD